MQSQYVCNHRNKTENQLRVMNTVKQIIWNIQRVVFNKWSTLTAYEVSKQNKKQRAIAQICNSMHSLA